MYATLPATFSGDLEIGGVELKDASADTRAKVAVTTSIAESDAAVHTFSPVFGATADTAVSGEATGSINGRLRALTTAVTQRIPLKGSYASVDAMPVTPATDSVFGVTTGVALDADGTGTHQQYLRGILKAFLARVPTDPAKESGKLNDIAGYLLALRQAVAPTLGAVTYLAISSSAAETTALAAGTYQLRADTNCWFRVNTAIGGSAAVAETAPAIFLMVGEDVQVTVAANGCINVITTGSSGVLGYRTVS